MTAAIGRVRRERLGDGRPTLSAAAIVLEVELDFAAGDLGPFLVRDLDAVLGIEAQVRVGAADDKGGCDSNRLAFGDLDAAELIGIARFCG